MATGNAWRSPVERVPVSSVAELGEAAVGSNRVAADQEPGESQGVDCLPGCGFDATGFVDDYQHVRGVMPGGAFDGASAEPDGAPTRPDCRRRRTALDARTDRHRQQTGSPERTTLNGPANFLPQHGADLSLAGATDINETVLAGPQEPGNQTADQKAFAQHVPRFDRYDPMGHQGFGPFPLRPPVGGTAQDRVVEVAGVIFRPFQAIQQLCFGRPGPERCVHHRKGPRVYSRHQLAACARPGRNSDRQGEALS